MPRRFLSSLKGVQSVIARNEMASSQRFASGTSVPMSRPVIQRRVVHDESIEFTFDPTTDDPGVLRRAFLGPFDRAAHAVQVLGYEQDDAVIDRILVCQVSDTGAVGREVVGRRIEIPADALSDAPSLRVGIMRRLADAGIESPSAACRVVGLRVVAILERWDSKRPGE